MADAFLMGQSGKKLVGDALVSHVLAGKTFSNASSNKLTGTMPNRGKVNHQLSVNGTYTIPQGYHDGTGKIFQSVNTKGSQTFTPSAANQTIAAGQYLTGTQTILGDANLTAANIKSGVTIFGITGSAPIPGGTAGASQILAGYTFVNSQGVEVAGSIPSKTATTYTPGTAPQIIAAGQYLSGAQTIEGDADLVASNIKSGANIFGVAGKASVVDTADANANANQILTGYSAYVNGVKVNGAAPLKGAQTYTPGTVDQHIAPWQYLIDTQTIKGDANLVSENVKNGVNIFGVAGKASVVDTADATATAEQILSGKTVYVNGSKVTGTMPNRTGEYQATKAPHTYNGALYMQPPSGFYTGSGSLSNVYYPEPDLAPGNIKSGVNIFGVTGTLKPLVLTYLEQSMDNYSLFITNPSSSYDVLEATSGSIIYKLRANFSGTFAVSFTWGPRTSAVTMILENIVNGNLINESSPTRSSKTTGMSAHAETAMITVSVGDIYTMRIKFTEGSRIRYYNFEIKSSIAGLVDILPNA